MRTIYNADEKLPELNQNVIISIFGDNAEYNAEYIGNGEFNVDNIFYSWRDVAYWANWGVGNDKLQKI